MQIGQLAKNVGVTTDTIRYYEKLGVLPRPERSVSRYRSYSQDDVARMQFVLKAKTLGFTLEDIIELMSLSDAHDHDMAQVKDLAQIRLQAVEKKLAQLQQLREALSALVAQCPGEGSTRACPIIQALDAR